MELRFRQFTLGVGFAAALAVVAALGQPGGFAPSPPALPSPTVWASPVDFFRKLLAADSAERDRLLAGRPAPQRQVLENSLREYESLAPQERELRLRALDLRAYLTPLLRMAPSNRVERVRTIPVPIRPLVESRLAVWDHLAPEAQQMVLANEAVLRLVVSVEQGVSRKEPNLTGLNATQLKQMEADIARWRELSESTRERVFDVFRQIFDASEQERSQTFAPLNEAELVQMRRALNNFGRLPRVQREVCLEGFRKFADLSPEERRQFLANAEEWRKMSASDRQVWRDLVNRLPPYPPGFGGPRRPPSLPSLKPHATIVATNG